jgi:acyl carrier protein
MTRFRYDVILEIQGSDAIHEASENQQESALNEEIVWVDWEEKPLALLELAKRLICEQPAYVALRHVGNGRITTEINSLAWLATAEDTETVGDLRDALVESESKRIDPEALWEICLDVPYDIDIQFSLDRTDGSYDVLLRNQLDSDSDPLSLSDVQFPMPPSVHQNWHEYANHPLQEQFTQQLLPQLREFMKAKLPDYMMPSAFVILNSFPLTPNGKINRAALPEPQINQARIAADAVPPSNTIEESLAAIWAEILDLAEIGTHHNFFELGGHSLKATQVINRIHQDLGVELPLRDIFNYPTIVELAQKIADL